MKAAITFGAVAFVLLLASSEISAEFQTIGPTTFYIERDLRMNWHKAWNYCAENNMRLFSLHSELRTRLLEPFIKGDYYWTSGNELAEPSSTNKTLKFVWANTGIPFTYTNWDIDRPNNKDGIQHCIGTRPNTKWNDDKCTVHMLFICE